VLSENFPGVALVPDVRFLTALPQARPPLALAAGHPVCHPVLRRASPARRPWGYGSPSTRRGSCALRVSVPIQEAEVVAAGFPCVDVSRAGLRKGLEGKVRWRRSRGCLMINCPLCMPFGLASTSKDISLLLQFSTLAQA